MDNGGFPLAPTYSRPGFLATAPIVSVYCPALSLSYVPGVDPDKQPRLSQWEYWVHDCFMADSWLKLVQKSPWFCHDCQDKMYSTSLCPLDLNLEVYVPRSFWWSFFSHEERDQARRESAQRGQNQDTHTHTYRGCWWHHMNTLHFCGNDLSFLS